MVQAYLNKITTAIPENDIHQTFLDYAVNSLSCDRKRNMLQALSNRSQIEHRYSIFKPEIKSDSLDEGRFYNLNDFPNTKERMDLYKQHAFTLAQKALDQIDLQGVTHLVVTSCTGFYAPGIDLQIIEHYGLSAKVERNIIGFMGCCAAINALKIARHIVLAQNSAKVLVVNIELCTLHLQKANTIEDLLPFLIFADGCAASIVSAEASGMELKSFYSTILPDSSGEITWHIGGSGFDMVLSNQVAKLISSELPKVLDEMLQKKSPQDFANWAVHPGGRAIIDGVAKGASLEPEILETSREILRKFGNMSSPTVMFVLQEMLRQKNRGDGCAIAFGPGVVLESMLFGMV